MKLMESSEILLRILPQFRYEVLRDRYLNAIITGADRQFMNGWDNIDPSNKEELTKYLSKEPKTEKMESFHQWEDAIRYAIIKAYNYEFPDDFWDDLFSDWEVLYEWECAIPYMIGQVVFFYITRVKT